VPHRITRIPREAWLVSACLATLFASPARADSAPGTSLAGVCPPLTELEGRAYRIGNIRVRVLPIFDESPVDGVPALYRLANRLHLSTRDPIIESQLLFSSGDAVSTRLIEETERNLRDLRYIREPSVRAAHCAAGIVDLDVVVRDVWTTNPGVTFERSGGRNAGGIKLQELNLLGLGKQLTFELASDADRSYYTVHWRDPDVRGSRWVHDFEFSDRSDGQGWSLLLERPFFALDTRWSFGTLLQQDQSVERVYRAGERVSGYGRRAEFAEFRYGRSGGLDDGWSRRVIFGMRREHATFEVAPEVPAPALLPHDRRLDYPFVRLEAVEDDFETTRNRDQIARTEDQRFGLRYALEAGWSTPALGADRRALLAHAEIERGWRLDADGALFADAALTTRVENGALADGLLSGTLRYYRPTGTRGVFFAGLAAAVGHDLDIDHELSIGGDTGLRGYPLRFQAGSGTALLTVEQRYFTRYSLLQLADVGAAVFFDVGRAFGTATFGTGTDQALLKDVGFGLRLGSTRSALGNVLHIDVAFPLDGPKSLDSVQFLVQTKRSF
jgi:hypothetical protein